MKNVAKMTAFKNSTCVNHHQKRCSRLIWSSNAQLTEFRIEEHHEEQVGTNILLSLYPLFLKP